MNLNDCEAKKVFNFILENKSIGLDGLSIFNRDVLMVIWEIISGKSSKAFSLTENQEKLLIDTFIKHPTVFGSDTPTCILENSDCIRKAMQCDVNSANYLTYIPRKMEKELIELVVSSEKFVLDKGASPFFRGNFSVALNSLRLNFFYADFFEWEMFDEEEANILIGELEKSDYCLAGVSHPFLKHNKRIALKSLNMDLSTAKYIPDELEDDPDIFKCLAMNDYFSTDEIDKFSLDKILDKEIMKKFFDKIDIYEIDAEDYRELYLNLFSKAVNTFPKIGTFKSIFNFVAEQNWNKHKIENPNEYENIFARLCSYLSSNKNLSKISSLSLIKKMKDVLDKKEISDLENAMKEYIAIYHSKAADKLEKLENSKNVLSKISALYVSKCKENHKSHVIDSLLRDLEDFYILDTENPFVNKRISYYSKKKMFESRFKMDESFSSTIISELQEKYSNWIDKGIILEYINQFVRNGWSNLESFETPPKNYHLCVLYKEASKLINRLNSGYISFSDPAITSKFKPLIDCNFNTGKYYYSGKEVNLNDLDEYEKYNSHLRIFNKIKRDISFKINDIALEEEDYDEDYLDCLVDELPFKDEFFKFDINVLESFRLNSFFHLILNYGEGFNIDSFFDKDSYHNLHKLLIDYGLVWVVLFLSLNYSDYLKDEVNSDILISLINNMDGITSLAKDFKLDFSKIDDFMLLQQMIDYVDEETLAVLGKDVILSLIGNTGFTNAEEGEIVDTAKELVCAMSTRNGSTVPYVEGECLNYKYSIYDSLDSEVLLAGIRTDACFKCCGNDNDFLHYCALNKNGFVLKITNSFDQFIARAGGFRHGNCVFINQLRTIYDYNGNYYKGVYTLEQEDIIKVFKNACEKIVHESQANEKEEHPIDFVFVNKSYALNNYPRKISDNLVEFIGEEPMDMENENWSEFLSSTSNLDESDDTTGFCTDYGDYSIICIASSKILRTEDDFIFEDVPELYKRKRSGIIVTKSPTSDLILKINKTKAIYTTLENESFSFVNVEDDGLLVAGDNWYIICGKDGKIIDSCVLENDELAYYEHKVMEEEFKNYIGTLDSKEITIDFNDFVHLEEQSQETFENEENNISGGEGDTTSEDVTSQKRKIFNLFNLFH